jgi:carbonic anhydrase/acetyltransferase-like protein (isoleucine patch superfamily)
MDNQHHPELIDDSVFIAPGAVVLGDVRIGAQSSVWYNAVLRGDVDTIGIGPRTNVQDGAVLHADAGSPCLIEDDVLIGIGAIVLNGAQIGHDCIIGAGTLITGRSVIPPRSMVLGVPGRVVRALSDEEMQSIRTAAEHYVEYGAKYKVTRNE